MRGGRGCVWIELGRRDTSTGYFSVIPGVMPVECLGIVLTEKPAQYLCLICPLVT
jgi:hypothetical protein